jgi:hypothetical protein
MSLWHISGSVGKMNQRNSHLWTVRPTISGYVSDDLGKVLGILYNEDVSEHFQMSEVGSYARDLKGEFQKSRSEN